VTDRAEKLQPQIVLVGRQGRGNGVSRWQRARRITARRPAVGAGSGLIGAVRVAFVAHLVLTGGGPLDARRVESADAGEAKDLNDRGIPRNLCGRPQRPLGVSGDLSQVNQSETSFPFICNLISATVVPRSA
jgi:hypothetical protein